MLPGFVRSRGARAAAGRTAVLSLCAAAALGACRAEENPRRCEAPERPLDLFLRVEDAFPELPPFRDPVGIAQTPVLPDRFYVLEKQGLVKSFDRTRLGNGVHVVVDLRERVKAQKECGLVGMAFHPDFADNLQVLLSYCRKGDPTRLRYARYRHDREGDAIDLASEEVLLEVPTPRHMHHSGQIRFDRDGYLVTSIGDTGPQGDPAGRAQDTRDLPGSFLRIDVDRGTPYAVPRDNPFAEDGLLAGMGRPEIYAWGFRNPWSFSIDRATGRLWTGDVGFSTTEEIDLVEPGGNYGWAAIEGADCRESDCENRGFVAPVASFDNNGNAAVIGGYVYRGAAIPSLQGTYVFSDFGGGALYGVLDPYDRPQTRVIFPSTGITPSSFHEDLDGELYLTDLGQGRIYGVVPSATRAQGDFPQTLSESGCVQIDADGKPSPAGGAIEFGIRMPLWSDGADKRRYVSVNGKMAWIDASGDLEFPVGSVLIKLFERDGELIEGRLLVRHADGGWGGYSYAWNSERNDGVLLEDGLTVEVGGMQWTCPSREDCFKCHTTAAGVTLGPELAQFSSLDALTAAGVLDADVPHEAVLAERLDASAGVDAWVRSYLHANCAGCHRPGGAANADIDLRYVIASDGGTLALEDMRICDVPPMAGDLGVAGAAIVRPGHPARSVLYLRMTDPGEVRMPPLGSAIVDSVALDKVARWIEALPDCE
jgi:glucose/arabinose dehydrogenase/mono/diheme cytochrome c family protein